MGDLLTQGPSEPPMLLIVVVCAILLALLFYWMRRQFGVKPQPNVGYDADVPIDDMIDVEQRPRQSYRVPVQRINELETMVLDRPRPSIASQPPIDWRLMERELVYVPPPQPVTPIDAPIDPPIPSSHDAKPKYTFWFGEIDGRPVYHKLDHFRFARKTGGGKCLGDDEPIFLADGRVVPAWSLTGETVNVLGVSDLESMRQVPVQATFFDNGTQPIVEIELDNGIVLKRTLNHPVWAGVLNHRVDAGKVDVLKDGRVRPSPRMRVVDAGWVDAGDIRVSGTRPYHAVGHAILCPTRIEQSGAIRQQEADIVICAVLLAEGSLTGNHIGFSSADTHIVHCMQTAVATYGCEVRQRSKYDYDICICPSARAQGMRKNPIIPIIESWGMHGELAKHKVIPDWVFELPHDQLALFLRIFFDCDGWVDAGDHRQPSINIALASRYMVHQIAQLALRFGISGTLREKENAGAGCVTWCSSQVDRWQECIGLELKAEKLSDAVNAQRGRQTASATDWDAWRTDRPDAGESFADCPEGYMWRKVVGIRLSEEHTTGITVHTDNHAFVGYVVEHNTWITARIVAQLVAQGIDVYYINPKFMPLDESGIDLLPIVQRCAKVAIGVDGKDSLLLLEHARKVMFDRIDQARNDPESIYTFRPIVVLVDELSAVDAAWKGLEDEKVVGFKNARKRGISAIDLLLRWGRQPKVLYGTTSQDAQAQNGPTNTGTAVNFGLSACHPSLDRYSLTNIFGDIPKDLPTITDPYQWWAVINNPIGIDEIKRVDVPPLTNEWIARTLRNVPKMEPEQQKVAIDSSMKKSRSMAELAQKMVNDRQSVPPIVPEQPVLPQYNAEQQKSEPEPSVPPVPPESEPDVPLAQTQPWSDDHIRVAQWMGETPQISQREVAKRLWGKNEGRWNTKAGQLMEDVRRAAAHVVA